MQPEPVGAPDTNPDPLAGDSLSPDPAHHGVTAGNDASAHEYCQEHAAIVQLLEINNDLTVMARESMRRVRAMEREVARLQAEAPAGLDASQTNVGADMDTVEQP